VTEGWNRALAALAGARLPALKRQAYLLCGNDAQAEELVQDALVRAFTRPFRKPPPESAEAYVRTVMLHLFLDGARRQARWTRMAPLLADATTSPDPADRIVDRAAVRAALSELSPRQRACIVLRYYQDLPVAQIAATLGLREGTVKRYLSEAMTRLSACLSAAETR
jgi:RNA polymerase sigma-70 factor (sigma-E family)